ncbi:MAG TPA: hypothetical protein VGR45_08975, partial [Stellaceae bacterium]|nr:hypothetical protein [Stellaceae bacterium]
MATNASNATSAALGNILTNAGSQSQNTFLAAPSGSSGLITGRLIVGADLPLPGPSSLGAVFSFPEITSPEQFLVALGTDGNFASKQVAFNMLAGTLSAAQMLALPTNNIYQGNGSNVPSAVTLSAAIDAAIGSTRGSILERAATGWQIVAPSSTSGWCWQSQGTGADPVYASCANPTTSITSASPALIATPSPITGTGTLTVTNPEIGENGATVTFSGTTACAGNDA